jgi:hypothetical protein
MAKSSNGMKAFLVGVGVGLAASMLNKNNRVAVKKQSQKAKHKVLELKDNTSELTLKVKDQVSNVQKTIGEMSKDLTSVKQKLDDMKQKAPSVMNSLNPRKAKQKREETIPLPIREEEIQQIDEVQAIVELGDEEFFIEKGAEIVKVEEVQKEQLSTIEEEKEKQPFPFQLD